MHYFSIFSPPCMYIQILLFTHVIQILLWSIQVQGNLNKEKHISFFYIYFWYFQDGIGVIEFWPGVIGLSMYNLFFWFVFF